MLFRFLAEIKIFYIKRFPEDRQLTESVWPTFCVHVHLNKGLKWQWSFYI
jgi:hypothetical protein